MTGLRSFALATASLALGSTAFADPIVLPTTGLGVQTGQVDPNWSIWGGDATGVAYAVVPNIFWTTIGGAQWITTHSQWGIDPAGPFKFDSHFDLSGYVLSSVQISVTWSSDNASDLYLNGTLEGSLPTFVNGAYSYQTTTTVSLSGLRQTMNSILFAVTNGGDGSGPGPVALCAKFTGSGTPVPEPTSIVVLGIGLALCVSRRRRRRR